MHARILSALLMVPSLSAWTTQTVEPAQLRRPMTEHVSPWMMGAATQTQAAPKVGKKTFTRERDQLERSYSSDVDGDLEWGMDDEARADARAWSLLLLGETFRDLGERTVTVEFCAACLVFVLRMGAPAAQ